MVITLIGYLLLALFGLAVLAFCWLTASCFQLPTRSSHSGTSSLTTTVGTGPPPGLSTGPDTGRRPSGEGRGYSLRGGSLVVRQMAG